MSSGTTPRWSWGMKYWTYICSTRYTPFGSIFAGGPPGVKTTSFTGLPLIVTSRPPTWKEPMSLSWIGACAQAAIAARTGIATAGFIVCLLLDRGARGGAGTHDATRQPAESDDP